MDFVNWFDLDSMRYMVSGFKYSHIFYCRMWRSCPPRQCLCDEMLGSLPPFDFFNGDELLGTFYLLLFVVWLWFLHLKVQLAGNWVVSSVVSL